MDSRLPLLVVAASCRALARSVTEAGYACRGVDLFADWDTQRICPVERVPDLRAALRIAAQPAASAWTVIGSGLENLLSQSGASHGGATVRLCGSPLEAVAKSRDPFGMAQALASAGIPALQVRRDFPLRGSWVKKPRCSGGGGGVRRIRGSEPVPPTCPGEPDDDYYFQQFAEGPVWGATFLAHAGQCQLVGVCRQYATRLLGDPFIYHGSIGPHRLPTETSDQVLQIGRTVSRFCGLIGWFGVDFVWQRGGQPRMLEINPRYTASMEILERAARKSLFPYHLAASSKLPSPPTLPQGTWCGPMLGKRYVYSREPWVRYATSSTTALLQSLFEPAQVFVTDIPEAGTPFPPAAPICTVWAEGQTATEIMNRLQRTESRILATLQ